MKHGMGRATPKPFGGDPHLSKSPATQVKLGSRGDARPPHSVFHPWLTFGYSWPPLRLWRLPPAKPRIQRRQVRDFANDVGQILQDLFERGNSSPGGHRKNLNGSWKFDAQFAVPALETLAQRFRPFRG